MSVIVKRNLLDSFNKKMHDLAKKNVYVGIPQANNARNKNDVGANMKNATLAYINELGSPAQNIPPRPFLVPGVKESIPAVTKILKNTVITSGDSAQDIDIGLEKAGQKARDTVKNRIRNSTDIQGLSDVTKHIRATRKKNRRTGVMKPLIDTGQMLNSITYVIRDT